MFLFHLSDESVFPAGCSFLSVPCSSPDGSCVNALWVPHCGSLCDDIVQQHALHPVFQSHVWNLQLPRGNYIFKF